MEKSNNTKSITIGFTGLSQTALIVLKLAKIINWSWFWVLAPLWISVGLTILLIIFFLIVTKNHLKN